MMVWTRGRRKEREGEWVDREIRGAFLGEGIRVVAEYRGDRRRSASRYLEVVQKMPRCRETTVEGFVVLFGRRASADREGKEEGEEEGEKEEGRRRGLALDA